MLPPPTTAYMSYSPQKESTSSHSYLVVWNNITILPANVSDMLQDRIAPLNTREESKRSAFFSPFVLSIPRSHLTIIDYYRRSRSLARYNARYNLCC